MQLTFTVLRCPDTVAPETRTVSGGEFTVGRGPGVDWVLPDPERLLSKHHFAVAYRGGVWQVADTSTNGTTLNSDPAPLGRDQIRPLRDGDRLKLGAYEIEARLVEDAMPRAGGGMGYGGRPSGGGSPFGDPFATDPLAAPPPPPTPFGESAFSMVEPPGSAQLPADFDPLAPDLGDEPFRGPTQADHSSTMDDAFRPPAPIGQMPMHSGGAIPGDDLLPDDWDKDLLEGIAPPTEPKPTPFAQPPFAQPAAPPSPAPPPQPGPQPGAAPLRTPLRTPSQAAPQPVVEPVAPFQPVVEPVAPFEPAQRFEQPVVQPVVEPVAPMVAQPQAEPIAAPAAAPLARPNPFDEPFDLTPESGQPVESQPAPFAASPFGENFEATPTPVPAAASRPVASLAGAATPPREAAPAAARAAAAPVAAAPAAAGDAGLLEAFFDGVGLGDAHPANPTAMMQGLGAAFRTMVSGLRAVLIARASIKSEFRIEQTMIRARGNNPLKFSAGDDDALAALLGTGRRTDMTPAAAIADALKDIRLHELASMAAMQTAVRALLDGLDPAQLRAQAEQGGGLSVLPAQRKARAWDTYETVHARTVQALSDDFDSVFGKAFARAYEQAMEEVSAKER